MLFVISILYQLCYSAYFILFIPPLFSLIFMHYAYSGMFLIYIYTNFIKYTYFATYFLVIHPIANALCTMITYKCSNK